MSAFDDAKPIIGLSPLFDEVYQFGQIRPSDPEMLAAHIGTYGALLLYVWVVWRRSERLHPVCS